MAGVLTLRIGGNTNSISAVASPADVSNLGVAPGTIRTDFVTVVVTGGLGPYTYSWVEVGGPTAVFASNPTAASTRFSCYFGSAGNVTAQYKCTVTDANLDTADSNTIDITLDAV